MRTWSKTLLLSVLAARVAVACAAEMPAQHHAQLMVQLGHSDGVNAVTFSPDGQFVLTGSDDDTARLWDVETGKELRRFIGHSNAVESVDFSPDGRKVLTSSFDKTARLWDVESGRELRRFEGDFRFVAFYPDGSRVLTGSEDKTVRLWDVDTGKQVQIFNGDKVGTITSVAFSPNGRQILMGSDDKTVRLWDVETGTQLKQFNGHTDRVASVAFSADGNKVVSGSDDATVRLWDVQTEKEIMQFTGHQGSVWSVSFSPDGNKLLTVSTDNTARLWDVRTGQELRHFDGHSDFDGSNHPIGQVMFSPDGKAVFTSGSWDGSARLWDAETGKELQRFVGHAKDITSVTFSPDGTRLVTASADWTARLWDPKTGKEIRRFEGHAKAVHSVAFSLDGRRVLTDGGAYSTVRNDNGARIWDLEAGKELRRLEVDADTGNSVAYSSDGRRMLTCSGYAQLWDLETGKEVRRFELDNLITSVALSRDGRRVLTGGLDNTARMWDAETGKEVLQFKGHAADVTSVAFSPDGKRVLTGSSDSTVKLWDALTGRELVSLISFEDGGWAVVDPEGRYDASDPDNSASLYWVTDNLRTIDLEQLKKVYYTPDLLGRVMRGARLPEVAGLDTVELPPLLAADGGYHPETHKLVINLTNDGGGVGRLLVKVNDRLVQSIEPTTNPAEGKSIALSIDLADAPFITGDNTIHVTAYNAKNRIESHPAIVHYEMTAAPRGYVVKAASAAAPAAGNFYAIVVGTSSFADEKIRLQFPAKDAESIATGLRLGVERLYGKDHVWIRLLTSNTADEADQPTKKNIRAAFDEVRQKARPEDTLLVYLSGHGAMSSTNRDLYYYLTADARSLDIDKDPKLRDVSTVSSDELFQWLREPVKTMPLKQVVILDTCAAGGAGDTLARLSEKREVPPDQRRAIELLKDATGTFILMGSAADAVSYEASRYGEGLLTYALLQGMRGVSLDEGSRLGVSRWFQDASEQVPELARSIGGIQKPVIAAPKGSGFPVALLMAEDRAKIPLAIPKPQLLRVLCEDENQEDPLNLRSLLRERLRAINYAEVRGQAAVDPTVMYFDATDDDMPDAISPRLRYAVEGEKVTVRIRLVADRKTIADQTVTGSASDLPSLATLLTEKIVAMATKPK